MSARPTERCPTAPTAVSLRRWLCAWLALLLLTQTAASTLASLHGSWHRHHPAVLSSATGPVTHWRHGEPGRWDAHAQLHARGEVHHHDATDASVVPLTGDAAIDAVAQLAATLAPSADAAWRPREHARHAQAGVAPWAPTQRSIAPPLQPPRG